VAFACYGGSQYSTALLFLCFAVFMADVSPSVFFLFCRVMVLCCLFILLFVYFVVCLFCCLFRGFFAYFVVWLAFCFLVVFEILFSLPMRLYDLKTMRPFALSVLRFVLLINISLSVAALF